MLRECLCCDSTFTVASENDIYVYENTKEFVNTNVEVSPEFHEQYCSRKCEDTFELYLFEAAKKAEAANIALSAVQAPNSQSMSKEDAQKIIDAIAAKPKFNLKISTEN